MQQAAAMPAVGTGIEDDDCRMLLDPREFLGPLEFSDHDLSLPLGARAVRDLRVWKLGTATDGIELPR